MVAWIDGCMKGRYTIFVDHVKRGSKMAKSKKLRVAQTKRSKRHATTQLTYEQVMAEIAAQVRNNEADRERRRALTYRR